MSAIRCIYSGAPPLFPATDQHPSAVRYQVGAVWVDAIGGRPTQAEVDAILNPPLSAQPVTLPELIAALKARGVVSDSDIAAARGAK